MLPHPRQDRSKRRIESRMVELDDQEPFEYAFLIVATGLKHDYFGRPEWQRHAPGLKTLYEALEIRNRVLLAFEAAERITDPDEKQAFLSFVVVGGGATGVELAGQLAEISRNALRRTDGRRPSAQRAFHSGHRVRNGSFRGVWWPLLTLCGLRNRWKNWVLNSQ
jgi:NADH dehydrogenase FAD-containing subunit